MDPAATDGELDIQLAIKEREPLDFGTGHRVGGEPGTIAGESAGAYLAMV